jgi:hypothetical protein
MRSSASSAHAINAEDRGLPYLQPVDCWQPPLQGLRLRANRFCPLRKRTVLRLRRQKTDFHPALPKAPRALLDADTTAAKDA